MNNKISACFLFDYSNQHRISSANCRPLIFVNWFVSSFDVRNGPEQRGFKRVARSETSGQTNERALWRLLVYRKKNLYALIHVLLFGLINVNGHSFMPPLIQEGQISVMGFGSKWNAIFPSAVEEIPHSLRTRYFNLTNDLLVPGPRLGNNANLSVV